MKAFLRNSILLIVALLTGLYLTFFIFYKNIETQRYVSDAVTRIAQAIETIDKDCSIVSIDPGVHDINFLNVTAFTGSEVGPLNLAHPDKWKGPYLYDNPTIYASSFRLIHTNKGYYVVPADGVHISRGTLIGRDVIFTPETDIDELLNKGVLNIKGNQLAKKINLAITQH